MSIKKQVLKSKPVCKVSFKISKEEAAGASQIAIVVDFNNWNAQSDLMKPLKDGSFSLTIDFQTGKSYQFRYLADNERWFDEPEADGQIAGMFGAANNLLKL